MNNRPNLSRLPFMFWVQLVVGIVILGVLAFFGLMILLGGLAVLVVALVVHRVWLYLRGGKPPRAAPRSGAPVIEGDYRVVEGEERGRHPDSDASGPR